MTTIESGETQIGERQSSQAVEGDVVERGDDDPPRAPQAVQELGERLDRALSQCTQITANARQGALLREGMTVVIAGARHQTEYDGKIWYFCCGGCKARFEADPRPYLPA